MNLKKFFKELKRRKVYQVAITYGLTGWILAQILDLVTEAFNAPDWVMQVTLVVLLMGFPIALILAWAYELSPDGVIRTDSEESGENPYTSSQKRPLINLLIIGALVVFVIFLIAKNNLFGSAEDEFTTPNSIAIAILPLINLSEDKEMGHFANQVTNDMVNDLAKVRPFEVTPFLTVYAYQNQSINKAIAEKLGVTYLMHGTARAYADQDSIMLNVELVNPFSGKRIWGEAYHDLMDRAGEIQKTIVKEVAKRLGVDLTIDEKNSLQGTSTENGKAYTKFLEARHEFLSLEINSFKKSIILLEEAVALDPNYKDAHILLAWVLTLHGWPAFKADDATLKTYKARIERHLQIATKLDPLSSDIHLVKANYALTYQDDLKKAERMVERALELNSWPELPTSLCICTAVTLNVIKGNLSRAKEIAHVAKRVDPGNIFILVDELFMSLLEGDYDKAAESADRALNLMDKPIFHYHAGWVYFHQGRYQEALYELSQAYANEPYTPPTVLAYLSNTYFKLGDLEKSNEYLEVIEAAHRAGETNVLVDLASIAAVRNQDNLALSYLEEHQEKSVVSMSYQVNVDPVFKKYEENPRFIALRKKMGYYD